MTTLIFDLGNVIAFFDHGRACRQIASLGRPGTTEDSVADLLFHRPLERDYDTGAISTAQFVGALRVHFGITAPDDAIANAWTDIFTPNPHLTDQLPGLKAKGFRLVVASNTNELHFARIRSMTPGMISPGVITPGVFSVFDAYVLSYQVGARKPAEAFFHGVLDAAQAPASACFYVDDRPDFVAAAASLGIPGAVYEPGADIGRMITA
jgi:putative hydrolase of the HAD superfamily